MLSHCLFEYCFLPYSLTSPEIIDVTSTDISVSKANLMATPNFKGQGGTVLSHVQKEEKRNLVKSPKNILVGPLCYQYSFPIFLHVQYTPSSLRENPKS